MKRKLLQAQIYFFPRVKKWAWLTLLLIIALILGRGVWRLWFSNRLAEERRWESNQHLEDLTKRKKFLENKIANLKTDRGLEEELRTNFSVVRPGEKVINLLDKEGSGSTTASTTELRRWWQFF